MDTSFASVAVPKATLRTRAVTFVHNWADASSEKGQSQTFWTELLSIFDFPAHRTAAGFEMATVKASSGGKGHIDLLLPGRIAIEQKSAGEDLDAAWVQLLDYLPNLTNAEYPWLLVVSDFTRFRWHDLTRDTKGEFSIEELPDHLDLFWWLAGHDVPGATYETDEEVNLEATKLLQTVHDELADAGYPIHQLRELLVRLLFCLFADDSGVWDRGAFHDGIAATRQDGSDLGAYLAQLFQTLNQPDDDRPTTLGDLAEFTYINGDLFEEPLPIAAATKQVREALLHACRFDWSAISPAIFGSMFQNVMEPAERRQLGAHYTTEQNILRTIRPLFLDDLEAELEAAKTKPALRKFLDKISTLTFFDPAAGCGNFLVIAYREMRRLETEALRRLYTKQGTAGQLAVDISLQCKVSVDQFYAIELEEFPAKIARTALYLMDHLANRQVSAEFGQHYARFPIPAAPNIVNDDALELDWNDVLPADKCDYCFGNPPFAGQVTRSAHQTAQMRAIWGAGYARWMDYVTTWYRKALDYGQKRPVRFAFVSTNSIAQGEQVARVWQPLLDAGFRIDFAYPTFGWTSEATGTAAVHVVIIGFSHADAPPPSQKHILTPDTTGVTVKQSASNISPYLTEGPNVVVTAARKPVSPAMPPAVYGNKPADGGGLVIDDADLPSDDPIAMKYVRRYVGARELIHDIDRWCLWMPDGPAAGDVKASQFLERRLKQVRESRLSSENKGTWDLAGQPYRFFYVAQPTTSYVAIPRHVSENRRYFTVRLLNPDVIASDAIYTAVDPDGFLFGILSSSMFLAWLRAIGGRIKSDYRYSNSVVHNTFPLPADINDARRRAIIDAGQHVLASRPTDTSLADMYNPLGMPPELSKAHQQLDKTVDAVLAPRFKIENDSDRLARLLSLYEQMTTADTLMPAAKRATRRKRATA